MGNVTRTRTERHLEPNPYAPKGTVEWAMHIAHKIKTFIDDQEKSAKHLEDYIKVFQEEKGYALLGFDSFETWANGLTDLEKTISERKAVKPGIAKLQLMGTEQAAKAIVDKHGFAYARKLAEDLLREARHG